MNVRGVAIRTFALKGIFNACEVAADYESIMRDSGVQSTGKSINIAPGKSTKITLSLTGLASGTSDFLIFQIDPNNTFSDINLANNVVVTPSVVTFG